MEREGFWSCDRIKCVALNRVDSTRGGNAGALGIEFEFIASNRGLAREQVERGAQADTWVHDGG